MTALVAVAATLVLAVGAAADEPAPHRPAISFAPGTYDDLKALATATWDRFLHAFPARIGCVPDVTVRQAWRMESRGSYDPKRRLVTVRIPGPAAGLSGTLVHEFAHHVEFTCPEQRQLRPRFLEAQGLAPGSPWRRGPTWARIPSEEYAEATVRMVLGRQSLELVNVRPAAISVIRSWGRGR